MRLPVPNRSRKRKPATARAKEKTRTPADGSTIEEFQRSYGFTFDDFQIEACAAVEGGSSVLVAAPTGAGKTVVGEFAAFLALRGGGKTFYTTPIKALSNQKFGDFAALHGSDNVGLLTGDNSINGEAPIVVMTTEVLRNMIYEDSATLQGLHYVVLDEVHYLQNPYRGGVWEEIIIHLPVDVQTISLSATVSNAEEFAEWLQTLRGRVEVMIEEKRPVELRHWYFAGDELLPMFVMSADSTPIPNPRGREFDPQRKPAPQQRRKGGRPRRRRPRPPLRTDVIERLHAERMLPAIYFLFSRKGCDAAVQQCTQAGLRLTTTEERRRIVEYADLRASELPADELEILGYTEWREGLARGIAAHHAGMIPSFKETVEELFARGLVKVVFATETLALGINMPARSVVIESITKFTGEKHEQMTPGEYTQLAGRAGRRGIDEVGHSVVLMQRYANFEAITRLASTRTYPLVSSFQPSYNMAVNLVRNYDRVEAEHLVNSSFAQFQADREVVKQEQTRERLEAYLASYRDRTACELGDFREYRELRRQLDALRGSRRRTTARADAIDRLRPGDVFEIDRGRRRGRYAVVEVVPGRGRAPRVAAVSDNRSLVRFAPTDFRDPPVPVGRVKIPDGFNSRDARARRRVAQRLVDVDLVPAEQSGLDEGEHVGELKVLQRAVERHPVHKCPEVGRHLHYAERADRLTKEIAGLQRRIGRRTGTLARRFERVLEVLEHFDYVETWTLTRKGETLTAIYNEADLLVVECLERGLLAGLDVAEMAAVLSMVVYETRGPEAGPPAVMPTSATDRTAAELMRLFLRIREQEESRDLDLTREPDPGFAERAYLWASGAPLADVLGFDDAPGDFVRSMKQLIDLLRQVEDISVDEDVAGRVREAREALHRGVVAYTSVEA